MDCSQGNSNSLPPFLVKTYEMVDDESTNEIVSWSSTNSSFVVWNPLEFAKNLLPKYFKHNNFSSFVRQLNTYGFHKVDPDLWEFANDDFIKGERHRLKNIHRRKPIFSHSAQNGSLSETERLTLEEEIERLKLEKTSLISEISKQAEIKQEMDLHMQSLEEKLQALEVHQKYLIEYLSHVVNKPGFISILRQQQQSDHVNKRRRQGDADVAGNEIPVLPLVIEPFERIESLLNSLESFFRGASEAFGQEEMYYDRFAPGSSIPASTVVITELNTSSKEDTNSPTISVPETPPNNKVSEIDMNLEPNNLESESEENQNLNRSLGQNDVFWEQYLTEHPTVNNEVEVQSERRDDERESQGYWLDKRNMECLTEKMVNLSSVGKT